MSPKLPSRKALRREFDAAVLEIDRSRSVPMLTTGFYSLIGDHVFKAGYSALADACNASGVGSSTIAPLAATAQRLHVVSAPVGSGKTSFSLAFIAAVVRMADKDAKSPFGCVVVVDQMEKADDMFRELEKLLPGKVAVWSTDHDKKCKTPTKVLKPAATFTKDDLQRYPVAVVTHAFFGGKGNHKAKQVLHGGKLRPRALTVIDERMDEVTVYDVALSAAQKVREFVLAEEQHAETVGPHMDELVRFMHDRSYGGRDIERPTDEKEAWTAADKIQWFTTAVASAFVRANQARPDVKAVFGFGKALATGYAFIARNSGGEKATHYIGYESNLIDAPGVLLLDATADIDGVTQLCTWRQHTPCPQARYDNLRVVSVVPHTKKRLASYLEPVRNRRAYVAWMVETIKANMKPGQRGLVICKKALFDNENVPAWPGGDDRHRDKKLFSEQYGWEIDGRLLCATHWGTGIGANTWKDADVVFLFDEFFIPRRTVIATAQGLQDHKATEGALASMKVLNSSTPAVEALWEGHLLRWMKQMALRGCGRNFDEHGVCGHQKLVCSADRTRLLANADRLFPGARIEVVASTAGTKQPYADKLLEILGRLGLPDVLPTKWIGQQMNTQWRHVSKNIMILEPVKKAIGNLGWTYVSRKGRPRKGYGGAAFERVKVPEGLVMPA
jgi:hypothetical protein